MPCSNSDSSNDRRKIEQGRRFEGLAARFYIDNGFDILERNWRAGHKEIDLIVRKGNLVAFVEVKSTFSKKFGHPVERVDQKKIHNLSECARQYIIAGKLEGVDLRFDVVTFDGGRLEHFPDAFSSE